MSVDFRVIAELNEEPKCVCLIIQTLVFFSIQTAGAFNHVKLHDWPITADNLSVECQTLFCVNSQKCVCHPLCTTHIVVLGHLFFCAIPRGSGPG